MHLLELCTYLDQLLQPHLFADYCKNGLQVEGKEEICKIGMGVSASLATIEAAVVFRCDALIVHHPLFWTKESSIIVGSMKKKIALLLQENISLIGYHLPLDAHQTYGNNWGAAREMGWKNLTPFGIYNGVPIGVIGAFEPKECSQFVKELEAYYDHPVHAAYGGKEIVENAALISGGAHKSITEAALRGVDCFITGNYDEDTWHKAFEEGAPGSKPGINFFAFGHSNTEKVGVRLLGEHLQKKFEVEVQCIDIPNPF